jgi:group I intron endonuclease
MLNGKRYVGLTRLGVDVRWGHHIQKSRTPKTYFHRALAKYGKDAFVVGTYASVMRNEDLSYIESVVIQDLRPEYNLTNGGEATLGRKYTDAIKEQIRRANTGKKRTPEQCKRISEAKKHSFQENPELRAKVGAVFAACKQSPEYRLRQAAGSSKAGKARVWSDESRAKLSMSCMGRRYSADVISRMADTKKRKIVCNTTGVTYSCRVEAAQMCGVSPQSVFRVCNGKYKMVKGLSFSYSEG